MQYRDEGKDADQGIEASDQSVLNGITWLFDSVIAIGPDQVPMHAPSSSVQYYKYNMALKNKETSDTTKTQRIANI